MKLSKQFSATLRDAPTGTDAISQQLLLRAGFIRQLGVGLYSLLPLGLRAVRKIESIREDLGKVGPVIAEQVEDAMLGRRRRLETRDSGRGLSPRSSGNT